MAIFSSNCNCSGILIKFVIQTNGKIPEFRKTKKNDWFFYLKLQFYVRFGYFWMRSLRPIFTMSAQHIDLVLEQTLPCSCFHKKIIQNQKNVTKKHIFHVTLILSNIETPNLLYDVENKVNWQSWVIWRIPFVVSNWDFIKTEFLAKLWKIKIFRFVFYKSFLIKF